MKNNNYELNCVLKSFGQVEDSIKNLETLNLPPHPDPPKSWDTWKIINFINKSATKNAKILDVGCNGSPILPLLKKLGFKNLYGCDVDLKIRKRRLLRRIKNKAFNLNPDQLLNEMLRNEENFYHLTIQDLEKTNYEASFFDFISSLSVIEHGINISNYLSEMNRILRPGGFLLTSTDYWPEKIETISNVYDRPSKDVIFDKNEIKEILADVNKNGFSVYGEMNFDFRDKVVKWKKTDKKYTFIFFCLQKKSNA